MSKRLVVFDIDDILWDLNGLICKKCGIDIIKINDFNIDKCNITDDEKNKLLDAYKNPKYFEHMQWYKGIENITKLESLGAEVHICSNSSNNEIVQLKLEQLHKVLALSDSRIYLNIITDGTKKEHLDNVFIFCDDSPYNLLSSDAKYKITINKPWNTSVEANKMLNDIDIIRCNNLEEVLLEIQKLLKNN